MLKLAALFCLVAAPALAGSVDVTKVLTDPTGKPYSWGCGEVSPDGKSCLKTIDTTLGLLVIEALNISATTPDAKSGMVVFKLQQELLAGKPVDLSGEEMKLITDALWAFKSKWAAKNQDIPTFEIGEATALVDPALAAK